MSPREVHYRPVCVVHSRASTVPCNTASWCGTVPTHGKRAMDAFLADYRWIGPHGIGRFACELRDRLPALSPLPSLWPLLHPLDPVVLTGMLYWLRPQVYFSPGFNPPLWSPAPCVF